MNSKQLTGTIILSLISLLERASFYGVRSLFIFYFFDIDNPFFEGIENGEVLGYWTAAFVFSELLFSIVTDKWIGQKRSLLIGGLFCLLGYSMLFFQYNYLILGALILLLIGTSLVKPSTNVLVGRLFKKEDKNRTLAFMILYFGINVGAFVSVILMGYLADTFGWEYGLMLAVILTVIFLILSYFFQHKIEEIETDEILSRKSPIKFGRILSILAVIVVLNLFFWKNNEIESSQILSAVLDLQNRFMFGFDLSEYQVNILYYLCSIPMVLSIFIFWYAKGVTNFIKAIFISLVLLMLGVISTMIFITFPTNIPLEWILIPFLIYAIAEAIITPLITSFVTRIAPIKYSNTLYSSYFLLLFLFSKGLDYLLLNAYQNYITLASLFLSIVAIIIFKDKFKKLTFGLK